MTRKKRQLRYGDPLPATPIELGRLPIGVAVRLDDVLGWWLTAFRIGLDGPVSLRPISSPDDPNWFRSSATGQRMFAPNWRVTHVAWPTRIPTADDPNTDPVNRS